MAEKLNNTTYPIPNEGKVVNVDFAIYNNEEEYVSPEKVKVSRETMEKIEDIKKRNIKIGHFVRTGELKASA